MRTPTSVEATSPAWRHAARQGRAGTGVRARMPAPLCTHARAVARPEGRWECGLRAMPYRARRSAVSDRTDNDVPRHALPIPDRQHVGLVTYDAKDPDTAFPPIERLLPPTGAPNVLVVLLDD